MVSFPQQLQNPTFALDGLFCDEERFDDDLGGGFGGNDGVKILEDCVDGVGTLNKSLTLLETDLFWEDDELVGLYSKEKQTHLDYINNIESDFSSMMARKEALGWILRVVSHYGFSPLTAVLAVNYYDRFMSGLCFQRDKPWMNQLAAVACLSVAAKVEETQVPLLLDLQVEDSRYVFEAKTIQRMELLVLSTLKWRMQPVTPISFFDHIVRRFGLLTNLHREFRMRCESLLLSVISDSGLLHYLPSVIATVIMMIVIQEIEPCNAMDYQNMLSDILKSSKEELDNCRKMIINLMETAGNGNFQILKRKHQSVPGSPNGVMDAYFSSDSSNDSWAVAQSVSSSPERLYKRSRTQDQRMRLTPLNSVSVAVGISPH